MTRWIIFVLATLAVLLPSAAQARYRHHYKRHWSHHLRHRHPYHQFAASHSLPAPCRVAASMGGPCGCWAAYVLLGRLDHVWRGVNLWLAQDWADKFPHVAPSEANAVVWPHRHVAPIVPGTYQNGTVVVRDSWSTHRIRTAGLIFVRTPVQRRGSAKYDQAVPL